MRFTDGNEVVDLVVGGAAWMKGVVERASKHRLGSSELPVVEPADLVLLKLYAGGPQDLLDARLLIAARPEIRSVVEARVAALPRDARDAWERL